MTSLHACLNAAQFWTPAVNGGLHGGRLAGRLQVPALRVYRVQMAWGSGQLAGFGGRRAHLQPMGGGCIAEA